MGNIREKPDRAKDTQVFRLKKLSYVVSSMCGWREFMEDSILALYPFADSEDFGLFGVFDGHGGPECSEYAAKYFPGLLLANPNFKEKKYEQALTETFLKVDELMRTKAGMRQLGSIRSKHVEKKNADDYKGETVSGTTANVCLLTKEHIYVANVGDSRAIAIIRGNKAKPKVLSIDHKPQTDIEKERILKAGGKISEDGRINNNLNLSRALGDFAYKGNPNLKTDEQIISAVPDITKTLRYEIGYIIMGCDGIWETKTNQEMGKWFMKAMEGKNATLKSVVEGLFNEEIAKEKEQENGLDNMSAIILQL